MRFNGGTLSLLLSATAVAASVFQNTPIAGSKNGLQRHSLFGVSKATNVGIQNTLSVPRGGASDDESEDAEADIPEVLYLPGLLGATVAKKTVSSLFSLNKTNCNVSSLIFSISYSFRQ